jgi:hypothetical protein
MLIRLSKHLITTLFLFGCVVSNVLAVDLIYLNTPAGTNLLLKSDFNKQFFSVMPYVTTEEIETFCGAASIASVLNSLQTNNRPVLPQFSPYHYFTQDSLFIESTDRIISKEKVATSGLTLDQLRQFLEVWAAHPTIYYGSTLTLSQFRDLITSSLSNPNQRMIVNFDRKALGQIGHGHFSPIGAYDSKTDSVLILDVAKYKYPPVWVKTSNLFLAIQGVDPASGKSRGVARITVNQTEL